MLQRLFLIVSFYLCRAVVMNVMKVVNGVITLMAPISVVNDVMQYRMYQEKKPHSEC